MTEEAPPPVGAVPGFTPEQVWVLDVVAERAAQKAIDGLVRRDCPLPCSRMLAVEQVVFGRAESGLAGLDARMPANERAIAEVADTIVWLKRTIAGALAAGGVGLAVWSLETLLRH
jgi:hypothetical protein